MATVLPRFPGPLAVAVAALLLPRAAAADDAKPAATEAPRGPLPAAPRAPAASSAPLPAWETAPASRRSGFTAGIALGFGLASIVGYPNDAKKIGFQRYYTAT